MGLEPTIYRTWHEHANHYTTDEALKRMDVWIFITFVRINYKIADCSMILFQIDGLHLFILKITLNMYYPHWLYIK